MFINTKPTAVKIGRSPVFSERARSHSRSRAKCQPGTRSSASSLAARTSVGIR
jgi:hypothetical protein